MPVDTIRRASISPPSTNGIVIAVLLLASCVLGAVTLARVLPPDAWRSLVIPTGHEGIDKDGIGRLLALENHLPRLAVGLIAGAGLALAGTVFQNVLRNPLAEPSTLGVSAGAQLALVAATLWFPEAAGALRTEGVALVGAVAAMLLMLAAGWSRALLPDRILVAGIFVSLYAGAVSGVLVMFNQHYLTGVFVWSSGSLIQNGWDIVQGLTVRTVLAAVAITMLARPLSLLAVGDESARGLGVGVAGMRLALLAVAVWLSSAVVSAVGMIAFIGLAAPAIARAGGARTVGGQLLTAPMIGAGLLCLTDQAVQLAPFPREVPTGAATALLGGPLLLWLMMRASRAGVAVSAPPSGAMRARSPVRLLLAVAGALILLVWAALALGAGPDGWRWLTGADFADMLQWRWPRVAASGAAGAMLAAAGVILQRVTANPMAGPEVLGISSGAALGLIVLLFAMPAPAQHWQLAAAACGAAATLMAVLFAGRAHGFSPHRLLLVGIATGTICSALAAVLTASGDPRMATLLRWMAGSTYGVRPEGAIIALTSGALLLALTPFALRPLEILPLGDGIARAVGVAVGPARKWLLLLAACLAAAGTLTAGPLTFVGLLAPHLARLLGFRRAGEHLAASVLAGAAIMIAADWLGRTVIFPYQIPAGLFAAFLAGPFFLFLLRRHR